MYAIGVDIGGTNTRVALIDQNYQIIKRVKFDTVVESALKTLEKITETIASFQVEYEGICVSAPGPLDLEKGVILSPPNLVEWHGFELVNVLSKLCSKKVYLENDANLAALAESYLGSAKGHKVLTYFTISTGIGGGLIIDNKVFKGAHSQAMEVANSKMAPFGFLSDNLVPGAIETIASGKNLTNRAVSLGLDVKNPSELYELAKKNQLAKDTLDEAYDYFSSFLGIVIGLIDPDIIVLGGSVATKTEGFVETITELTRSKVYDVLKDKINIKMSILGDDGGLLGAAIKVFLEEENV